MIYSVPMHTADADVSVEASVFFYADVIVPLPISKRSSPLLSAKASFRRLGSSQRRTLRGR